MSWLVAISDANMHRMRAARFAVFSAIRYSAHAAAIEGAHPTDPLVFAAAENQR